MTSSRNTVTIVSRYFSEKVSSEKMRLKHRSLIIFSTESKLRKFFYLTVQSMCFEYLILGAIITSCVVVAIEPVSASKEERIPYVITDVALSSVFAVEVLMKAIAYGFICHSAAYLRSAWNVFDFTVVVFGE